MKRTMTVPRCANSPHPWGSQAGVGSSGLRDGPADLALSNEVVLADRSVESKRMLIDVRGQRPIAAIDVVLDKYERVRPAHGHTWALGGSYCREIATLIRSAGSTMWSWLSSPMSIWMRSIFPLNLLGPSA
jgi:hypothetical protein